MSAPEPEILFGAAFMPEVVVLAIIEGSRTTLFEMSPRRARSIGRRLLSAADDADAEPLDLEGIIAALSQG